MSDTAEQRPEAVGVAAPVAMPIHFSWMTLWTAAGGVAGAAAIVYGVGFGIEALRLSAAGLPVEEAISVVPKTAMLSLSINAIFLKTVLLGVLTAVVMLWVSNRAAAMTMPEAVLRRGERANVRRRRWHAVVARLAPLARPLRRVRCLLGRVTRALRIHRVATAVWVLFRATLGVVVLGWRHTLAHVRHKFWITLALLYTFLVPWTAVTIYGVAIVGLQVKALSAVSRRHTARLMSARVEAVLVGVITACSIASMTLIGEAIRPGPLPRATIRVDGAAKPIIGDYVATTNDGVYVGVHRKLMLIPDHRVSTVTIYDAPAQKPEKPETLIQRLR